MKVSKTGYKKNYNKNEPALIVPSSEITMRENNGEPLEKGPILGIDNLGNMTMMQPGLDYSFPGSYVYEIPMANAKNGGYILPGRYRNPEGNWVSKYAYGGDISIPDLSRPNWLDKAQKGQQVKYYDDPKEFKKANQSYNKEYQEYLQNANAWNSLPDRYRMSTYDAAVALARKNEKAYGWERQDYPWVGKEGKKIKAIDLPIKPVYKEKPKGYIPTKTVKLEREPIQLVMPQSDRTLMPYNNTMQVLSSMQQEDRDKQGPKVVPAPDFRYGGWLDKYQSKGQVTPPANLPWINQQGQFTQVPPTEPKNFESRVDDFLGNPMQKARDLASWASGSGNDPVDNLRHSAAAANMAHSAKEKTGSALAAFAAANMLGAAHELYALPGTIKSDGWYHGLRSTAEDLFNNAVGAGVGVLPHLPIEAKESLLVHLTDNNKLPDGVSMAKGDMYWKKKDGGESQGKGYYDYIGGYSIFANGGVSSKQSSWLNKYK